MDARGLSQAKLAEALGVHDGNVRRWRTGKGIEIENVWALADYFGVERNYLARLAGYPDSEVSITDDGHLAEIDALYDADRAEVHEELREIPQPFWSSIWAAQRAARRLAIDNARIAIELVSSLPHGELAPPATATGRDDDGKNRPPSGPLTSVFAPSLAY
jgi:transcriptional regulator with XRE-family HTH domain